MWYDSLQTFPVLDRPDLVAEPVRAALSLIPEALVFAIDPDIADTEIMCATLGVPLNVSANVVLITGVRQGDVRHCACMVLATRRVDVNNVVRRRLDVRKASFSSREEAVTSSGMEYGGITPVGLPIDWPVWLDESVADQDWVCVGSGIRGSKLILPGSSLLRLPGAALVDGLTRPIP